MKKYWTDIDRKNAEGNALPEKSLKEDNSLFSIFTDLKEEGSSSRRDFLKLCGYSFAVTALASCQTKIRKAVPYAVAPLEITPGEANYYASSYVDGSDYCSIIVKTRDGRPIKIEGNPGSGINAGGTGARVQASVLELYDTGRYREPLKKGEPVDWGSVDGEITSGLKKISDEGGRIVLLTPTIYSPSTETIIRGFMDTYPGTDHIPHDAISYSAMLDANLESFGQRVIPDFRFDRAELVLSFGADFLGTWISPLEYTKQFASRRDPDKEMTKLLQFESNLSLTGSNADRRIQIKPSQEAAILLNIYNELLRESGSDGIHVPHPPVEIGEVVSDLKGSKERSLVISASNDKKIQLLVNEINRVLGNIGTTILFDNYLRTISGSDSSMEDLINDMEQGKIDALILYDVSPAYTWPEAERFKSGMGKVGLTISLSGSPDETSILADYVLPDNHYLESWNDLEPRKNKFSLMQPVMDTIFNTRQMQETLLKWSGQETGMYEFLNTYWEENFMPLQTQHFSSTAFFDHTLQSGVFEPDIIPETVEAGNPGEEEGSSEPTIVDIATLQIDAKWSAETTEFILYQKVSMGNGRQANNPWLQELPDPLTRICWDNYACISPRQARELELQNGDIIGLGEFRLPVFVMAGQAYNTIGIALGYGRNEGGNVGTDVGLNAYPLARMAAGNIVYTGTVDGISKTGDRHLLAQTQTHHTMEGRHIVREADVDAYREDAAAGNEMHAEVVKQFKSLYPEREYNHHHWGMAIDLTACTGCANCVIACQAENNIPVVGKDEVSRVHEMHWIRIDRYFTGDEEDPEVVFQPVMCQHCDNAPCENVCPVAATNQSGEGLNQMVYNRCIGTRYCNNNCPYKVRRFNWFNYTEAGTLSGNLRDRANMTSDLRRLVLNPDVTVRSQGVIEKCSFCIQRIQSAKLTVKAENRGLLDGELQTACSQSCPSSAIVFGDMNDERSDISKLMASGRRYNLLEEIYTKPSVHYLTKIRNRES